MKHRPQLSSQLSQGSSISSKVDSVHSGPQLRLGPRSLADSGRSRSQSVNSREPIIVMSDDIRPMLLRDLNGELERKKREQQRLSANMASVAAATQRISARNARAAASLNGDSSDSASGDRSSRGGGGLFGRSRRQGHRAQPSEYSSYVEAMRAAGETNLEEFLIQEAIRMSLAEQEQAAGNNGGEASPREASAEEAAIPEEQETENQACQTPAAEVGGNRADEDDSSSSNSYPASGDGDANHENHAAQETGLTVSDSLPVLESSQTTLAGASPAHTVQINTSQTSIPTSTQVSVPASPTVATAAAATTVPTSAVTAPSSPLHDPLTFDAAELDAIANVSSRRRGPSASNHGLQVVTSRTATPAADATPATADSGRHRDTLEDLVSIAVEQARTSPTRMHQRQNTNPFINAAVMSSDDAAQFDFPALLPQAAATPSSPRSPRSPPPLPLPQSATTLHSNSKSMSNVSPVQSPRFSLQDPFGLESIAAASTSAPHSPPPRSRRRPPPPPPPASTSARGRAKSASHTQSDKPTPVVSTAVVSQQAAAGAATPAHSSSTTAAAPALILL
ncbi:hypothetical protein GQ54DRAFT_21673 [Martensiomyces pterosporus]|nr:hypothetical protein GQ54DRAFT_21673 [Martensiomyces pterosporus]